jgi:hypothetical protein
LIKNLNSEGINLYAGSEKKVERGLRKETRKKRMGWKGKGMETGCTIIV